MNSQINKLIQDITRVLGENQGGAPLRENNILSTFTPDYVVPRPFKDLPNVSKLWMRGNRLDPLLSRHGVARKLAPEMAAAEYSWRIKACNRYLRIMYYRIEKVLRGPNPNQFWVLALELMKRSRVLKAVALRKLDRNWHRNFKLGLVKLLLSRLDDTIQELRKQLVIIRQYEDKIKPDGSKTWRPVGSPAYVDRMYLYIWQSFVVMYVEGFINKSQHAYRPKRGVKTALVELKKYLSNDKYKYAWEFDLKGAFPSVDINWAMRNLHLMGMPKGITDYIRDMSIVTVERVDLVAEDKKGLLPEPKFEKQELLANALPIFLPGEYDWVESQLLHAGIDWFRERKRILKEIKDPMERFHRLWAMILIDWAESSEERHRVASNKYMQVLESDNYQLATMGRYNIELLMPKFTHEEFPALVEYRKLVWERQMAEREKAALDRKRLASDLETHAKMLDAKGSSPIEVRGFPQGSGLSPVLFNLVFEMAALRGHLAKLHPDVKVISYADDFIVFSPVDLPSIWDESQEMKDSGLVINKEKSRVMKSDGQWVVPKFKYLGVTFHTNVNPIVVEGSPRSGNNLVFDKMTMVQDFIKRDEALKEFAKAVSPLDYVSPQKALDLWGEAVRPWSLIPYEVVSGERGFLPGELDSITSVIEDDDLEGAVPEFNAGSGNFTASEVELATKHLEGKPLNAFGTRLAGLIINRLHGGGWTPLQSAADRSLKPGHNTQGLSWIERMNNISWKLPTIAKQSPAVLKDISLKLHEKERVRDSLSIYNSTTLATADLLRMMDGKLKLTRKGLKYS